MTRLFFNDSALYVSQAALNVYQTLLCDKVHPVYKFRPKANNLLTIASPFPEFV